MHSQRGVASEIVEFSSGDAEGAAQAQHPPTPLLLCAAAQLGIQQSTRERPPLRALRGLALLRSSGTSQNQGTILFSDLTRGNAL